jgi:hypothetical protein
MCENLTSEQNRDITNLLKADYWTEKGDFPLVAHFLLF